MLTDAEYQQIMKCKAALQSRMNALSRDIIQLAAHSAVLSVQNASCKEEMKLYDSVLKPQIDEYEAAIPVEEPE